MTDVKSCRTLVCQFIDDLGLDSFEQRVNKDLWVLRRGSAVLGIFVFEDKDNPDESTLYVSARVMKVPLNKALPFYRKLLELNKQLFGSCAFSVDDENIVHLSAGRPTKDMSMSELANLVHTVSWATDKFDDALLDEFGRENVLPE